MCADRGVGLRPFALHQQPQRIDLRLLARGGACDQRPGAGEGGGDLRAPAPHLVETGEAEMGQGETVIRLYRPLKRCINACVSGQKAGDAVDIGVPRRV